MSRLSSLWEVHSEAGWPGDLGPFEGELMTLESTLGGCVRHSLVERGLDTGRVQIVEGCLADLENILPDLSGEGREYFGRLRTLAYLMLTAKPDSGPT